MRLWCGGHLTASGAMLCVVCALMHMHGSACDEGAVRLKTWCPACINLPKPGEPRSTAPRPELTMHDATRALHTQHSTHVTADAAWQVVMDDERACSS